MALARAGRATLDKPGHVDRYTVHVVADLDALLMGIGRAELMDGTPIAIDHHSTAIGLTISSTQTSSPSKPASWTNRAISLRWL